MNAYAAVQEEMRREQAAGRVPVRIRVTPAAIPGVPTCLPMQSLRFKLGVTVENRVEVLIHPDDWREILEVMEGITGEGLHELLRAFGLPVANETP